MEKIQVTDAMRQRILTNIDKMVPVSPSPARTVWSPAVKGLMSLAACFALLLAGSMVARRFIPTETVNPQSSGSVMISNGIEDVADADALSQAVGFPVAQVSSLPFQVDEVSYTSFWGELAQITYTGAGHTASFRQSLGEEDNSGDYNIYAVEEAREMGGRSVTLKGDGQTYPLAIWTDGTYAYSLRVDPALTLPEWETVIAGTE